MSDTITPTLATRTAGTGGHADGELRAPVAEVRHLSVAFEGRTVVHDVDFTLHSGECVAIVGESGSGKSVTARSLLGLNGHTATTRAETLRVAGVDVASLDDRGWRRLRGRDVGYVLQDALVSLDPLRKVGAEIAEPLRLHRVGPRKVREERVLELLDRVGVPEPELRARQLPAELSGGLRQRALIAAAIALDPKVLIADEPTTALDTTVQAQILLLLHQLKEGGTGLLLISHDLGVVQQLADHVLVMQNGVVVEQGPTAQVLHDPQHPYTRRLLAAIPSAHERGTRLSEAPPAVLSPRADRRVRPQAGSTILHVDHVTKRYRGPDGVTRTVVDDVSFELRAGETLGIVGESGSGKSTTAAIALALTTPDEGRVLFEGQPWSELGERDRRSRRPRIAAVSQDPLGSFDPRRSVGALVAGALRVSDRGSGDTGSRVRNLLNDVGLPAGLERRHPLTLSGGQRQRVAIARALATDPDVLVLDEAVSALDVSVQAQVLDLLADIQTAYGMAALFISHDLGVIHHVSDRVLVLKDGRVIEQGTADEIFRSPQADYTQRLLAALPGLDEPSERVS